MANVLHPDVQQQLLSFLGTPGSNGSMDTRPADLVFDPTSAC
jgi:hypothetical protein